MPAPLSMDLRRRVVEAMQTEGLTREGAGERFGCGPATVCRWVRRMEMEGSVEPRTGNAGRKRKASQPEVDLMLQLLSKQPDATREELADNLVEAGGPRLSVATVGRLLRRARGQSGAVPGIMKTAQKQSGRHEAVIGRGGSFSRRSPALEGGQGARRLCGERLRLWVHLHSPGRTG